MIVKILKKSKGGFPGVNYNTNKVDRKKGELMLTANFGLLQGLTNLKPEDYVHYLKARSDRNSRIVFPQLHTVLSSKGNLYDKQQLTRIAAAWLKEMGYGNQPYLVVFHKDTDNNHVHLVTTRVDKDGRKINSAFEKYRAIEALDKVLGYDYGLSYRFGTSAQFYLVIERAGYPGKDYNLEKLQARLDAHSPDKVRATELREVFERYKDRPDFIDFVSRYYHVDLVMHSAAGKPVYGYSVIDHDTRQVFKGSEILSLKYLRATEPVPSTEIDSVQWSGPVDALSHDGPVSDFAPEPVYIRPISIADDIDDEAILGRNRHRKKKARTNTR
jgi:hypothetical protein